MSYYTDSLWCGKCGADNKNTLLTWFNQYSLEKVNKCSVITLWCADECGNKLICYGVWEHIHSHEQAVKALPIVLRVF